MTQNEYEIGKVYPRHDGTQWIFLGYYLEMPVWKVEGKHEIETDNYAIDLRDRSEVLPKAPLHRKKSFLNSLKSLNVGLFIKKQKV